MFLLKQEANWAVENRHGCTRETGEIWNEKQGGEHVKRKGKQDAETHTQPNATRERETQDKGGNKGNLMNKEIK